MTNDGRHPPLSRRVVLGAALASGAGLALPRTLWAAPSRPIASPPGGFVRLNMPGRVVRISKTGTLQPNGLWPEQAPARVMLERAMTELTGKSSLAEALKLFVTKEDRVAIKPNGLGGRKGATMASNKELMVALVEGLVAAGVPVGNITIFDQYDTFLRGTRVVDDDMKPDPAFPVGIQTTVHSNKDAVMEPITVSGISTRFVRPFTEATVVINVPVIKDHGICGYTGAMKNITHGSIVNPQQYHEHGASPQIAELYAQDIVRSRVALHILDGFKAMYEGGPSGRDAKRRVPHESVYVSTDPVALDVVGWQLVDRLRKDDRLPTLQAAGREPTYIKIASQLGLGVFDPNRIRLREVAL
jgi:uncharacterized protein (DUF362 family)